MTTVRLTPHIPHLEHIASLALLIPESSILVPEKDGSREFELRTDHYLGLVRFYDHLGLPVPLLDIRSWEIDHMFNYLLLHVNLHQPQSMN
jgi:hypothetical protein